MIRMYLGVLDKILLICLCTSKVRYLGFIWNSCLESLQQLKILLPRLFMGQNWAFAAANS